MTPAALIGADTPAVAAVGVAEGGGAADEDGCAGDGAEAGGAAGVPGAGVGAAAPACAAAASASDAASAQQPDKSVAIGGRAGRGTGESYRKSRGASRANYFMHETVKLSKIHGMLAHRA
jgi:hypothetical protein